jgi:Arc/MetJ-type ribon-helix-helix transcriptional regulator
LDELVARGRFNSRTEALRAGITLIVREEREREIAEAFRLGYTTHPQPNWVGNAGLGAFAAFDRA